MSNQEQRVSEILRQAAGVVDASDLPADLRVVAFEKAVDMLATANPTAQPGMPRETTISEERGEIDETRFFANLARESGVSERDLRDVLQLTDGNVSVTTPTKDLGSSISEQAKNVIALVASARSHGLGEHTVNAEAVRGELQRKHCFQSNNFATGHLGPMKGFNAGSTRNEIVLTSRWVEEFKTAITKAHGRTAEVADQ